MSIGEIYFGLQETMSLPSTEVPTCDFCGLDGEMVFVYSGVDAVGPFGGGFSNLCQFCDEINSLLWDLSEIKTRRGAFRVGTIPIEGDGETEYLNFATFREADEFVRTRQHNYIPAWHVDRAGNEIR
ncbi:hypothetical protein SEA_LABELLE_47 [Mycobacterium phage Labelle]|nr:hypothetical protein SEA_LABELLE_47 [Mycobacterium phage Labelle]